MPSHPHNVYLQKLVRDRIPARIEKNGDNCETRTIETKAEFLKELAQKSREEAVELSLAIQEFARNMEDSDAVLSELADLSAVMDEILYAIGCNSLDLNAVKCEKLRTHGGYQSRTFLERTWREEK